MPGLSMWGNCGKRLTWVNELYLCNLYDDINICVVGKNKWKFQILISKLSTDSHDQIQAK